MKIAISPEEYRLLIDLLEIADWVLQSYRTDLPPETEGCRDLQQKLYALAAKRGAQDLVQYDSVLGQHATTREYEKNSEYMSFIEDYEENSFWDELIPRLADRDLVVREGVEAVNSMDVGERVEKLLTLEEKYACEFEANSLKNLQIR